MKILKNSFNTLLPFSLLFVKLTLSIPLFDGALLSGIGTKNSAKQIRKNVNTGDCNAATPTSSEEFTMRMNLCKGNVSLQCDMGGSENCFKDKQSFKTIANVDRKSIECLLEANTGAMKMIRFVVKAKLLHQNQAGSRGMGEEKKETQRGQCTLGYSCIEDEEKDINYLKDIKITCYSFLYNAEDEAIQGKDEEFHEKWIAPPKYQGPIEFGIMVTASYSKFVADVSTSRIDIPTND